MGEGRTGQWHCCARGGDSRRNASDLAEKRLGEAVGAGTPGGVSPRPPGPVPHRPASPGRAAAPGSARHKYYYFVIYSLIFSFIKKCLLSSVQMQHLIYRLAPGLRNNWQQRRWGRNKTKHTQKKAQENKEGARRGAAVCGGEASPALPGTIQAGAGAGAVGAALSRGN